LSILIRLMGWFRKNNWLKLAALLAAAGLVYGFALSGEFNERKRTECAVIEAFLLDAVAAKRAGIPPAEQLDAYIFVDATLSPNSFLRKIEGRSYQQRGYMYQTSRSFSGPEAVIDFSALQSGFGASSPLACDHLAGISPYVRELRRRKGELTLDYFKRELGEHAVSEDDHINRPRTYGFSRVGLDRKREFAMVYAESSCGIMCAYGGVYYMRKNSEGSWERYGYNVLWNS